MPVYQKGLFLKWINFFQFTKTNFYTYYYVFNEINSAEFWKKNTIKKYVYRQRYWYKQNALSRFTQDQKDTF